MAHLPKGQGVFLPPFKAWLASNIPAVYDNTMTYYEELCALIKYLQDVVIPALNHNAEAVTTIATAVEQLQKYVEDYFKNLDVQEEINNKLDQMVEDGTLQEIIASYLQANVAWTFDTVADMQASDNLINGSYAQTLGYYSVNDGGASLYKITDTGTADGGSTIAVGDLFAHLVIKGTMNVKQFGAVGDGTTDDSVALQNAIDTCDSIEGLPSETYLADTTLIVEDKIIKNLNIKASAYEYDGVNEQHEVFRISGNNEFTNVSIESEFVYEPSIQAKVDPSIVGLASNVKAFACRNTNTNFYSCKTNYCYAYWISSTSTVNVYDSVSTNSESNFVLTNSDNKLRVYNSKFTVNKAVNSIYYHHVYLREGSEAEFNNCTFTETGTGNMGNHYHAYSTTVTSDTVVDKKLIFNDCTLITTVSAGQLNCADLYVNGGVIKANNLMIGGDYLDKASAHFNNVDISLENDETDTFYLCRNDLFMKDSEINYTGVGHIRFSTTKYQLVNTAIKAPSAQLSCALVSSSTSHITDLLLIDNCYFDADTFEWCYPLYSDNVQIKNTTYNLRTTKATTNPMDRGSTGYMYNCVFSNRATPLSGNSNNDFKYSYISAGVAKTNTTTS